MDASDKKGGAMIHHDRTCDPLEGATRHHASKRAYLHEHQGNSCAMPDEAQHAGLGWAMAAIDSDFCTP